MEVMSYGGWEKCIRMQNGEIELVITQEVGPRIIRAGFVGKQNLFKEFPDQLGKTGGDEWRIYGGHRLWHAPEANPRTYFPDNQPVAVAGDKNILVLTSKTESTSGIQKKILLQMSENENRVKVTHQLINQNLWPIEFAVWSISVMTNGGIAIVPQEQFVPQTDLLTPIRPIALWGYTNMSDPRWRWGQRYVTLQQRTDIKEPTKAGFGNKKGWVAYGVNGFLFIKLSSYQDGALYPDFGSSTELYTNQDMCEVETLSPLEMVSPGEMHEHIEHWFFYENLPLENTDESIHQKVLPLVEKSMEILKA